MALQAKSLFLHGFKIEDSNKSIDFRAVSGGAVLQATLTKGYYNLDSLLQEIKRAMEVVDPSHLYNLTVNRTISGGTQNRVTIATNGTYLDLLFGTGPRSATTTATLIGFAIADRTGATTYTGTTSAGTILITDYVGYNYLGPNFYQKVYGSVNVSASGSKEAVVYNIQKFIQCEFKYEPQSKVNSEWADFWSWAILQKFFEFTPEISSPSTYYAVTLESSIFDSKGLGFKMTEMLPAFPFKYTTGTILMRLKQ